MTNHILIKYTSFNIYSNLSPWLQHLIISSNFRFREVEELVTSLSSALNHVMSHDHERMVALCSVVSLEWYVADYACAILGIPTVSMYVCMQLCMYVCM